MARPIYETQEHRDNEQRIISYCEKAWGLKAIKINKQYQLDFCCKKDNKIVAFIEVKKKSGKSNDHPNHFISAKKRMAALELYNYFGVACILVFEYDDGIFYCDFLTEPDYHCLGGRYDNRDGQDMEPMVNWYNDKFKKLEV